MVRKHSVCIDYFSHKQINIILRTETRVGEYIDTNNNHKVVYVCAFVGKLNSEWKRTVKAI
jgi:hypothetical protein